MKTDTEKMHSLLIIELENVTAELNTLGVQNPAVSEDWIPTPGDPSSSESDPNELGDRSEEWNERRGVLDALETRFNNINRALQKIKDGTYGVCEIGGEQIEDDRLGANPAARTCKAHINDETELTD
jgi:RNA polymerase-binding transcription factor DksA